MSATYSDLRREGRLKAVGVVYYSDRFDTYDPAKHITSYVGETVDISDSGACITTKHFFSHGSQIKVSFRDLNNLTAIATVRWCLETEDGIFRVGLRLPDEVG